jgi:E217 gateway protein gp29
MFDNEMIVALRSALLVCFAARGLGAVEVLQNFQSRQQGRASGPVIYFQHLPQDRRYGWPEKRDVWNEAEQTFDHIESQQMEATYQFSALAEQDPANDTELTPADYAKAAAAAFQSDPVMNALRLAGIGVLRVTTVRIGYSDNDREQFQQDPSFDVTFTHRDTTIDVIKPVEATELNINRV